MISTTVPALCHGVGIGHRRMGSVAAIVPSVLVAALLASVVAGGCRPKALRDQGVPTTQVYVLGGQKHEISLPESILAMDQPAKLCDKQGNTVEKTPQQMACIYFASHRFGWKTGLLETRGAAYGVPPNPRGRIDLMIQTWAWEQDVMWDAYDRCLKSLASLRQIHDAAAFRRVVDEAIAEMED